MIPILRFLLLAFALVCAVHSRPNQEINEENPNYPDSIPHERQGPFQNIISNIQQSPQNPINIINNLLGRTTTKAPVPEDGEPTTTTTRRPFLGGIFNGILNRPGSSPASNGETTTRGSMLGGLFTIFNRPTSTVAPAVTQDVELSRPTSPTLPPLNLINEHLATAHLPGATITSFQLPQAPKTTPPPPIAAPSFMNRIVQIFQQVQNGFTNTLGGLLQLPRSDVPQNVRESTENIMKLANANSLNFQPVMDQLPFLAVMSPQRQFESILRIIRPTEGSKEQDFFQSTNAVLDYLSNPRFSSSMRSQFFGNFPNIHNSLQDMWINVSQFMASYNVQALVGKDGAPADFVDM